MTDTQMILFDYTALDIDTRVFVQERTRDIKALMKRTAQDIVDIGGMLTEVKAKLGHGNFGEWLLSEFDWRYSTALRFMQVFEKFKNTNLVNFEIAPSALYLLAAPSTPDSIRNEVMERAEQGERITHSLVKDMVWRVAPQPTEFLNNPATWQHDYRPVEDRVTPWPEQPPTPPAPASNMAVHYSSETPEWYTPPEIIERVIASFGEIDLDPCSNSRTNPNIPAKHHLTAEDNGLTYEWGGKVYMNPPYGREIVDWTHYLKEQYECGNVTEAIALVPSRTDTEWFRELRAYARCFIWGRLKFSESENSAPFPSMVVYFGSDLDGFKRVFGDIGDVYCLS